MSSVSAYDTTLEMAKRLSAAEQMDLAMALLADIRGTLGGEPPKPSKKSKAKKAEDAEPKEKKPNSWLEACAVIRAVVGPLLKEVNEERSTAGEAKIPATCTATITKGLRDAGKFEDGAQPTEEEITTAFNTYVAEWEPAVKDSASASSGGSKTTKSSGKKKLADMTADEKKAHYAAIAAKAKATKAAKKAAAEAEKLASAEPSEDEEAEGEEGVEDIWKHGAKTYRRINGKYLWDALSGEWVGEWDGKKIDRKAEEPKVKAE